MPRELFNALSPRRVAQERRPGMYADGNNLYLIVAESGARWWCWRGTIRGRRRELGIGSARLIALAEARETAREWKRIARAGGDPQAERDAARRVAMPFEEAARQVWAAQIDANPGHPKAKRDWLRSLERSAFPVIGKLPVDGVTQADVLRVLAPIWIDKPVTAKRVRQRIATVLDWARTAGFRDGVNPCEGIEKGLPKQRAKVQHLAALPFAEMPEVMAGIAAIDTIPALVLRFAILTAVRSGEARGARWDEVDFENAVWTIPAARMKAKRPHRVPLPDAAIAVLETARAIGDGAGLIFPSPRGGRVMSGDALTAVLRRLGLTEVPTVHGFRSAFRDWCAERTSAPREIAEMCLAHVTGSAVERAYMRTDVFEKRRALMARWAAFVTDAPGAVVPIRARP
jgi:integrase